MTRYSRQRDRTFLVTNEGYCHDLLSKRRLKRLRRLFKFCDTYKPTVHISGCIPFKVFPAIWHIFRRELTIIFRHAYYLQQLYNSYCSCIALVRTAAQLCQKSLFHCTSREMLLLVPTASQNRLFSMRSVRHSEQPGAMPCCHGR